MTTFKDFLIEGYRSPKFNKNRALNHMGAGAQPDDDGIKYKEQYISIPYDLRMEAKKYGAQWDPEAKSWYVIGEIPAPLKDMLDAAKGNMNTSGQPLKIYLNVPYKEKDEAKRYGVKWDSTAKKWYYAGKSLPMELERWRAQ